MNDTASKWKIILTLLVIGLFVAALIFAVLYILSKSQSNIENAVYVHKININGEDKYGA